MDLIELSQSLTCSLSRWGCHQTNSDQTTSEVIRNVCSNTELHSLFPVLWVISENLRELGFFLTWHPMEVANIQSYRWIWVCMTRHFPLCFSSLHPLSQYLLDLMTICTPTSVHKIRQPHCYGHHCVPLSNSWLSTNIVINLEEVKHLWRMVDLTLAQSDCSLWGFISSLPKPFQGRNRSEIRLLQ